MQNPDPANSIYLMPGDFFWGNHNTKITTVLGSCVSICAWHPQKKIGGICHFRLPGRRIKKRPKLNAAYGDDAIWLLLDKIKLHNTETKDYIIKVFGGAEMFTNIINFSKETIGSQNVSSALTRLHDNGFSIHTKNIHGKDSRKLIFNIDDGSVLLYQGKSRSFERF